jgi:ParB family chromosome partitioning protein
MSGEKVSKFGNIPPVISKLSGLGMRPRGSESQGEQTVPGRMLAASTESVGAQYQQLKAEVQKAKDSGLWVMELDPKLVHPGPLADRLGLSLDANDPAMVELRRTLKRDGQIQPISVRPRPGHSGQYEIVTGNRRHAAALQLDAETEGGFKVRAVLDGGAGDVAHRALRMYAENAARMNLSPYELALAFRRWLDDALFASQDDIAAATDLSKSSISKYLALAAIPEAVIAAFPDPRAISLRWSDQLWPVLKEHRAALLNVAARITAENNPRTPEETLRALLGAGDTKKPAKAVKTEKVSVRGRTLYQISPRGNGFQIKFGAKLAPEVARAAQEKAKIALTEYLSELQNEGQL